MLTVVCPRCGRKTHYGTSPESGTKHETCYFCRHPEIRDGLTRAEFDKVFTPKDGPKPTGVE